VVGRWNVHGFVLMRCVMHVWPVSDPVWSNRCMCILGLFQRLDTMVWPMSRPMPWGATMNSLHGPGHGHQYVSWSLPLGAVSLALHLGCLRLAIERVFFPVAWLRYSCCTCMPSSGTAPPSKSRVASRHTDTDMEMSSTLRCTLQA
jgi:hypothetical protein